MIQTNSNTTSVQKEYHYTEQTTTLLVSWDWKAVLVPLLHQDPLPGRIIFLFGDAELQDTIVILCFYLIKISSPWHADSAPDKLTASLHAMVPMSDMSLS